MNKSIIGVVWAMAFVVLEALQYVYFGGLFQRMSTYLFGFLVFGVTVCAFVGWSAVCRPDELRKALEQPGLLFKINISATLAWGAYLTSVQLIEPAVAYTIGAGTMPVTAYVAYRLGVPEGEAMRNRMEGWGNLFLVVGIVYLAVITIAGWSGFVRGGPGSALAGVFLAIVDGVLFTWLLIYCQRLGRTGVGAGTVFGLRFPLYVLAAGALAAAGIDFKMPLTSAEVAWIALIGLCLVIPPLFALQKALELVSTLTIGALTALGPFVIFGLQMLEGRVAYSQATLSGLAIYFAGALLAALGAVRAAVKLPANP